MRYLAAAIQYEPEWGARESNRNHLAALVREAASRGAQLIVLPEMATTGYVFGSREEMRPMVEPIPGPSSDFFSQLAVECGAHLVVSYPEVEPKTDVYYNTAVLIDDRGQLLSKYRKIHSFVDETRWAKDGDVGVPVVETALGHIAMMICMDADYFETARLAALAGAQVIAFPTNWLGKAPSLSWRARALENRVFVVAADRWGEEKGVTFAGGSCIIAPQGEVVAQLASGDGIVMAEINLPASEEQWTVEFGNVWERRQPQEYHGVVINSYLWAPSAVQGLPASRSSTVGVVQLAARPGQAQAMLESAYVAIASGCSSASPDLLVLPETFPAAGQEHDQLAQTIPGPFTDQLMSWAREFDVYLVAGIPERTPQGLYSSVVLVGPEDIYGLYRKLHLTPADEQWCQIGDLGLPVVDLPLGRIALLTATDLFYPEIVRCAAKRGADLICAPGNWSSEQLTWLWGERWVGNDTGLAVANLSGGPWAGSSGIYGNLEQKERLSVSDASGVACLVINTQEESRMRQKEMLRRLQPFWYDGLVAKWTKTNA